jgi:hypothetical protein
MGNMRDPRTRCCLEQLANSVEAPPKVARAVHVGQFAPCPCNCFVCGDQCLQTCLAPLRRPCVDHAHGTSPASPYPTHRHYTPQGSTTTCCTFRPTAATSAARRALSPTKKHLVTVQKFAPTLAAHRIAATNSTCVTFLPSACPPDASPPTYHLFPPRRPRC